MKFNCQGCETKEAPCDCASLSTASASHGPWRNFPRGKPWEHGDLTEENGDLTRENCDLTQENGDLTEENGDLTWEHGDLTEENGDLTEENGD